MWKTKRDFSGLVLVATMAIATLALAVDENGPSMNTCDPEEIISSCGNDSRCGLIVDSAGNSHYSCTCLINYVREISSGKCVQRPTTTVPPRPETTTEKLNGPSRSSGSSVAIGLLVPTFIIILGVLGFCAARRYGLLPCRRNLYGNVLVTRDDDDDDPPIA